MDPNTLRSAILQATAQHDDSVYLEDAALAATIGEPLADVQKQIRILEASGLLEVVATFGPTYAVRLTPKGELAVEPQPPAAPTTPIGF
jgi:hypothetical protein